MSNSPAEGVDSGALLGYGSSFQVASADSPGQFHYLAEIFNITPPSSSVDQIDVTHMQSPGRRREFIAGLIDPGETSFEMNFIPGSESDEILFDILATPAGQSSSRTCRVIFPNGVHWEFTGVLMTYEPAVPTDDKMTATVTFRVSGDLTRVAAS